MTKVRTTAFSIVILILSSTLFAGLPLFQTKPVQAQTPLPSNMPVIFVDPLNITANPGETVTISVKIFNLSNTVHLCDESPPSPDIWSWGESLPPYNPNGRFNYSLGNLYGLEIQFSWDSNVLEYVNHTLKIPEETYPDGILHEPILDIMDEVDDVEGTYLIAQSTLVLGDARDYVFNKPDDNATVFEMTFKVVKIGRAYLNITSSDLAVPIGNPSFADFWVSIPHRVINGEFQTEVLVTRIQSLNVKPLDNDTFFTLPVISGENVFVGTTIVNDGSVADIYNLTLHRESTLISSWLNRTLGVGESASFNYTINGTELSVGNHTVTADLSILHQELNDTLSFTDQVISKFRVIGTPNLEISGPDSGTAGEAIEFTSNSTHSDPNGVILNYTWTLWAPGESQYRDSITGTVGTFDLHFGYSGGEWIVKLWVTDNYGLKCDKKTVRPKLLEFYQTSTTFNLKAQTGGGIFDIENIILIVIIIIVIALAVVYLRRRSR
jgi:hypothetical protein